MGWPFLWPASEPWPVCDKKYPELIAGYEASIARLRPLKLDGYEYTDEDVARGRESLMECIEECRRGHNASYLPVLQLIRSDFPEMPFPEDMDLFQLLWCGNVHFEGGSGYLVYWRQKAVIGTLREDPPPPAPYGYSIVPCSLDPERIDDYPDIADLKSPPFESLGLGRSWYDAMKTLGPAPGTKLFGHPKWEQEPEYPSCPRCAMQMSLLVAISSDEFGHLGRRSTRWMPYEEHELLPEAPSDILEAHVLPHDWMIGDGGDAWLFYCRNCPGEFDSRVQCS